MQSKIFGIPLVVLILVLLISAIVVVPMVAFHQTQMEVLDTLHDQLLHNNERLNELFSKDVVKESTTSEELVEEDTPVVNVNDDSNE